MEDSGCAEDMLDGALCHVLLSEAASGLVVVLMVLLWAGLFPR